MGIISDVNVSLNINHTWSQDLFIFVVSPGGTAVRLFSDRFLFGFPPLELNGTYIFDDNATATIPETRNELVLASVNFFQPITLPPGDYLVDPSTIDRLSDFNGEEAGGVWALGILNLVSLDVGTLNS